ncbi:hypothetical protein NR402_12585 [Acidithiobacillus ferrooxidans]|uniref:hypothetical protein n=1 Tax=Acidithiobacillus ferrooxidans TaxID=920 RepID=UPI000A6F067E|nr:hypothetical protein [Acidithiobacillus ferrooxidans]MCR2831112.1 hypothetical protein [Acidithiobacillus ferrooxidans]
MNTGSPIQRTTKAPILMMAVFLITSGVPDIALAGLPTANATPAQTISPKQLAEIEAYEQAALNRETAQPQQPIQQAQRPSYSLAPWVIVMRDAITTLASALWIAATGFAIGFVLWGVSRLVVAWRKSPQ